MKTVKFIVNFVGLFVTLLLLTGCSSNELNDKDVLSKEENEFMTTEIDTTNSVFVDIEDTIESTQNIKEDFETERIDRTECEVNVSDNPINNTTSKPSINSETTATETINKNPAVNASPSNPITNSNSTTNSKTENEELPDNSGEDVLLVPQISREAFDLINAERVKLGLEPAVWDAECERIALIRGEEIASYAIPEHDGFLKFQNENRKLCECLAWGYLTAEGAVDGWMNSSAHKDILMDPDYVKLAVARIGNKWVAVNSR